MSKKISIKLDATNEQKQHMEHLKGNKTKLHNSQGHLLPYSKLGKYLIDNFGEEISDAIRKDIQDERRK
jgi:hypothetical protein